MYKKALLLTGCLLVLGFSSLSNICYGDTEVTEVDLGVYKPKFNMLDTAIKQNPDDIRIYLDKADLHLRFYQLEEAKAMFEKALALAKDETTKTYLEAAILFCDLKLDEAAEKLDALIEEHPECKRSTFLRGMIYLQRQELDKAIETFEKVLELDINYLEAMNQLGWIYINNADYDKAIEYFNQVLYRDEHYMSAVDGKGYALYKLGLYKEALPYINEVIILLPDNWGAWTTKGEIYFSQGEYYLANYCLSKAEAINPDALEVKLLKEKLRPLASVKKPMPKDDEVNEDKSEKTKEECSKKKGE